jgi:glycosyltransferase involved in cell wall biosynthesis
LPSRYLLSVGTVEPRKNVQTLLTAFADLPAAVREACPLVLAGPWGWKSSGERAFFETTAKPLGAMHLGYVADDDLPALYAGASALLFPTFYEGFGLPPLEMLACGGAVVCSSTSEAVREVVGPCGEYVHPSDVPGWREMMRRAATDDLRRRDGVERAAGFTWKRAAMETLDVYRAVLGQRVIRRAA